MSIRIKIAKWLAPEIEDQAFDDIEYYRSARNMMVGIVMEHRRALRNIIALKTPNCAHVGKRMADIAETALSHSQAPSSPNNPTPERER